jgi:hypothetical protein
MMLWRAKGGSPESRERLRAQPITVELVGTQMTALPRIWFR